MNWISEGDISCEVSYNITSKSSEDETDLENGNGEPLRGDALTYISAQKGTFGQSDEDSDR